MRNRKRMGAFVMAAALGVTALAGCGTQKETNTSSGVKDATTGTEISEEGSRVDADGNWTGDTSHIVMTLITAGTDPVDMQKVQKAVNDISVKKIGVEVEFKPVSYADASSQVPMWIGAGEQIDLMACAFTGISPYIDMNMIEPLDDYLESEAPNLQQMEKDGVGIYDTTTDEHVYGVRTLNSYEGNGGGYLIRKDWLDEAGFSYENWDAITLDDLDEIFEKIKENHPECHGFSRCDCIYDFCQDQRRDKSRYHCACYSKDNTHSQPFLLQNCFPDHTFYLSFFRFCNFPFSLVFYRKNICI